MINKIIEPNVAIVIGGSVAGLLTAKVLAEIFDKVIVLEKDNLKEITQPTLRKGVPQAYHQHVLLEKGREIIEELFPGFDKALASHNAPLVDYTEDFALFSSAGRLPNFRSDIKLRLSRRILIDWILLDLIKEAGNIEICDETAVDTYLCDKVNDKITGVRLKDGTTLAADLVIDASGRGSKTPNWLLKQGYDAPTKESVDAKLGYSTQLFEPPKNFSFSYKAVEVAAVPTDNPRAAGLWQIEDGRWLLTLIGTAGHYPPTEQTQFYEFAQQLASPMVYDLIKKCQPCSDIKPHRSAENRRYHYENVKRLPTGLLVIGDGYCALNPLYGQGMTLSAMSVKVLQQSLQKQLKRGGIDGDKLRKGYFTRLTNTVKPAWFIAVNDDLRWPTTTGGKLSMMARMENRFVDTLMPLSTKSKTLVKRFLQVTNMTASPTVLLDPIIIVQYFGFYGGKTFQGLMNKLTTSILTSQASRLKEETEKES